MSRRAACGWASVAIVLLGALTLVACGNVSGGEVLVTLDDSGTAVALEPGQDLVVRLESNPSTGYSWEVIELPGALEGERMPVHETGSRDEGVVGAAGTDVFRFTAAEQDAGEGTLLIVYRRAWETDIPAEEEFTLEVTLR